MRTLFLDPRTWDLAVDTSGNLAIATNEYQQAQDIATSCRVYKVQKEDGTISGDDYYNKNDGIPILEILGKSAYPLALYQRNLYDRSLMVDGVVSVDVKFDSLRDRVLEGRIIFTTDTGFQGTVGL